MRKPFTLCAFLALSLAGALFWTAPVDARSLEGEQLDTAVKDDFFSFFHLNLKNKEDRDNLSTYYYQPARDDIIVSVDTDKKGKILQMGLIIGRAFIDDPKTNVFARDIVKSFIDAATPASDAPETESVVNEIFFRHTPLTPTKVQKVTYKGEEDALPKETSLLKVGDGELKKGDVAIMMNGPVPTLPEKVSDAYKAFDGSVENAEQKLTNGTLVMKNHTTPKGKMLEVRVDVKGVKKVPKFEVVPAESKTDKS